MIDDKIGLRHTSTSEDNQATNYTQTTNDDDTLESDKDIGLNPNEDISRKTNKSFTYQ